MMKIAHVTATFPPYRGGTGTVCYENARHLAERGHDVTVLTAEQGIIETFATNFKVKRFRPIFRFGNAPLLPQLLMLEPYDIVHLHYPFIFGAELIWLRSFFGQKYLITYHQDLILPGLMGKLVKLHHATMGQLILRRAARLMPTSLDYGNASAIAALQPQIAMPNGVDTQRFHPQTSHFRKQYGFAEDDFVLLFVGGLDKAHYFKGVDVLLHALQAVPEAKLLIVGDGDLKSDYQSLSAALGIQHRLVFAGRLSDEDLPLHYNCADVLVLPSVTMGEAFGLVLLEAMASGIPVIASNLPGVRSLVNDGQDGLLVEAKNVDDLAKKIRFMAEQPEQRHEMGRCGREKAEKQYSWSGIVQKLEAVYEAVIANDSKP